MGQLSVNLAVKVKELQRSLKREERTGVSFPRYFTSRLEPGITPYDQVMRRDTRAAVARQPLSGSRRSTLTDVTSQPTSATALAMASVVVAALSQE